MSTMRISLVEGKHSKDYLIQQLDNRRKLKGFYTIEQQLNIISITPNSMTKKKLVIASLTEFGYGQKDYFIPDKHQTNTFYVPEEFYPLRQSLPQFMAKCYNPENAGLDAKINIATISGNQIGPATNKHKKKIENITYDEKVKSNIEIIYHQNTCKDTQDLVINFQRSFTGAFEGLKRVIVTKCGARYVCLTFQD